MTRARENADLPVAMTESGGKVGIANSSPSTTFQVGDGSASTRSTFNPSHAYAIGVKNGSNHGGFIGSDGSSGTQFSSPGGAARMTIDGSGRVTMPYQPMFSSTITDGGVATQGDVFAGRTISNDFQMQGFTFNSSNGRFTCPVSGKYLVSFYSIHHSAEGYVQIRKNDNAQFYAYSQSGTAKWRTYSALGIISLAANDYLTFFAMATAANHNFHGSTHMRAVAYLIG